MVVSSIDPTLTIFSISSSCCYLKSTNLLPTKMAETISVGQYLFKRVAELGNEHVFGVPGDFNRKSSYKHLKELIVPENPQEHNAYNV
jgi:hypothetical protein